MDFYTTEFNHLNKTSFDINDLFCTWCKSLFKTDIFTSVSDGVNICERCFNQGEQGPNQLNGMVVNPFLKRQLSSAKFPCLEEKCRYIGAYEDLHKQHDPCAFKPVTCPLDQVKFTNTTKFLDHLSDHGAVRTIELESLQITIELNAGCDKEQEIIIAHYKGKHFLVFVKLLPEAFSLQVVKHFGGYDTSFKTFTTIHTCEKIQTRYEGVMIPIEKLGSNALLMKTSLFSTNPKLTIYFTDYEIIKGDLSVCSVCFQHIVCEMKLCSNSHAVCISCASRIVTCPVCRVPILNNSHVNANHVLPNFKFPCDNFDEGCMEFMEVRERSKHMIECVYRKVRCKCGIEYGLSNFRDHFINVHKAVNNFAICTMSVSEEEECFDKFLIPGDGIMYIVNHVYMMYRGNLFRFTAVYVEDRYAFKFRADVIINPVLAPSKYRYEVVLFDIFDNVLAKVSHRLQTETAISVLDVQAGFLLNDNIKCQYSILYDDC